MRPPGPALAMASEKVRALVAASPHAPAALLDLLDQRAVSPDQVLAALHRAAHSAALRGADVGRTCAWPFI